MCTIKRAENRAGAADEEIGGEGGGTARKQREGCATETRYRINSGSERMGTIRARSSFSVHNTRSISSYEGKASTTLLRLYSQSAHTEQCGQGRRKKEQRTSSAKRVCGEKIDFDIFVLLACPEKIPGLENFPKTTTFSGLTWSRVGLHPSPAGWSAPLQPVPWYFGKVLGLGGL